MKSGLISENDEEEFLEFCRNNPKAIENIKKMPRKSLENLAIISWYRINKSAENAVESMSKILSLGNSALESGIKVSERGKNLNIGRNISNKNREKNAAQKQVTLEQAVRDYLNKAKNDGLDKTNKAIVLFLEKQPFRTQLKQTNEKPYTSSTFKRDVELAAAKWRAEEKKKAT